jgi:ABC-2 type transport system ATP-binding protein
VSADDSIEVSALLERMRNLSIDIKDLQTQQSSLEDIFVSLVRGRA